MKITFDNGKFRWREGKRDEIILAAVGDIGLSKEVNIHIEEKGHIYPFEKLIPEIKKANVIFGNLECILVNRETKILNQGFNLSAPAHFIECFSLAGFSVLNLANNHTMDFGLDALEDTLELLKSVGINNIGAGKNCSQARLPAILQPNGIRIGFLGYAQNEGPLAGKHSPGVAYEKPRYIKQDVQKLKKEVDLVIVSLHTDTEFASYPSPFHIRICHKIVDWGASLILCHHSHVPQGLEIYKGGLICYSLGNCVFHVYGNSYLQKDNHLVDRSYILKVWLDREGPFALDVVPFGITKGHRPECYVCGTEREEFLNYIQEITDGIKNPLIVRRTWEQICRYNYYNHWRWMKWEFKRKGWKWIYFHLKILLGRNTHRKWIFGFFATWLANRCKHFFKN